MKSGPAQTSDDPADDGSVSQHRAPTASSSNEGKTIEGTAKVLKSMLDSMCPVPAKSKGKKRNSDSDSEGEGTNKRKRTGNTNRNNTPADPQARCYNTCLARFLPFAVRLRQRRKKSKA